MRPNTPDFPGPRRHDQAHRHSGGPYTEAFSLRFGAAARATACVLVAAAVAVAVLHVHAGPSPSPAEPAAAPATASTPGHAAMWKTNDLFRVPKWSYAERPKVDGARPIFYEGLPWKGHTNRVFALLGLPKLAPGQKAPGMVLIHGGGGTAFEEWVRLWTGRGYAAIAMDTCGSLPVGTYGHWVRDELGGPPGWGGWDQMDSPREEQWTFHAVADAILAHSLLASLPEVDSSRIGVTGISWGGYLTCIVAGVDPRFRFAAPVYGCGFTDQHAFARNVLALGAERARQWMAWWDPSVYLPDAGMPILWVTGSNDFAYTLNALQNSYRLPSGPRTLCVRLRMPHAHGGPGENPEEIRVFAEALFNGGVPLPTITGQGRNGDAAWATFKSPGPLKSAELNYTKDKGAWQERKWESLPATIEGGSRVTASLPADTTVYYFNLVDERNCVVSTEHEERAQAK